jgi:DNA (cytosine-5)-methyltransferase 1
VRPGEIIVDLFAGGGGVSLGIEQALGIPVTVAINHDELAVAMHEANHPNTLHFCKSVFDVHPLEATQGRPVGLLWASPDCTHFSRAKGGKPVSKRVRDLAWVVVDWACSVQPRIICLENVLEFRDWGPLIPRCDDDGNPMFDAKTGEPVLVPDPERKGETFREFVGQLKALGYKLAWAPMVAADYGAPTTRKRLFLIARRDRQKIRWPKSSHGGRKQPAWRTAAECIDWSIPIPSIFERKRPLAENTLKRIARGIVRYVLEDPSPFIVRLGHWGGNGSYVNSLDEPLTTITTKNEHAIICPTLIQTGYGERPGQDPRVLDLHKPLGTAVAGGTKHALVAAFLARHYGGHENDGSKLQHPFHTVTAKDHHAVIAAHVTKFYGNGTGADARDPLHTITAGGSGGNSHLGLVAAFLTKYYGSAIGQRPDEPLHTATAKARFGVVTVSIDGEEWALADIGMRMLEPRELARAQGFPDSYILTGSKAAQVARIGNSVCPPVARAIVEAQFAAELAAVV